MTAVTHDPLAPGHYVNPAPFNQKVHEELTAEEDRFYRASSLTLIWWKFKRHRVALASAIFLGLLYLSLPFVEIIAPYGIAQRNGDHLSAPPQGVHLFHEGRLEGPFVYPYTFRFNKQTFQREYVVDTTKPQHLRFFCQGAPYEFWGM